jgi:hypothetical protein
MSYRNPEIITDKSGEILAQGFASFGQSMAKGVATAIEKADQIKKQREAETARLRELQTEIDIESGKRAAEFKSNLPKTSLNTKLNSIIDERIKAAGDAQMDLYNESDPKARGELLKTIQNADSFLINTGAFLEEIKGEAGAWKGRNPGDLNKTYGVTGVDEADRANRLGLLNLLAGDSTGDIDLQYDPDSNSLNLNAYGKIGKENWKVEGFNSNNYLASGSELFYEIPQMTENIIKSSTKIITNPKGELLPEVVGEVVTKRIYQDVVNADGKKIGRKLVEGQIEEINQSVIDNLIGKEISASVAGFNTLPPLEKNAIFSNQLDAPYKSYNDFLEQVKNPSEQDKIISQMFKEKTIEGIGEQFESYEKDGQKVYFRSVTPLKEVKPEKPETPSATDKKAAELQKTASDYYDQFIANPVDFLGTTAAFSELLKYDGNIIQLNLSKPGEKPDFKAFDPTEPQGRKLLFDYWIGNSGLGQPLKDKLKEINLENKGNIIPKEDEYYGQ